jgi:hypothetical protein
MNAFLPLAMVAIAGTSTFASADNSFSLARLQPITSSVYFDFVNSDAIGIVDIYDYRGHEIGALLGSKAVALGSNAGLRVQMNPPPFGDVLAVLSIDGVSMADQVVQFRQPGH